MWSDDLSWVGDIEFNTLGVIVDLVPVVPANPTADEWYDCGDETGYSRFYFTLPTTDVDGNGIDPEYLSYSIFTDNGNGPELFTFLAEDYTYDLNLTSPRYHTPSTLMQLTSITIMFTCIAPMKKVMSLCSPRILVSKYSTLWTV